MPLNNDEFKLSVMDGKEVISHKLYDGPRIVYLILNRKNAFETVVRNEYRFQIF